MEKKAGAPWEDEREEHPTFGMISLHRVSTGGGGACLFGSSVRHHNFILVEIRRAERVRALHSERAYGHEIIASIYLSPVQLSELLTSANTSGVPCTLKYYRDANGKWVAAGETPETAKAQKTYDEFEAQTAKASSTIRAMQARLRKLSEKGKTIGKQALGQLVIDMGVAAQEVDANMPFILTSFAEACEGTVRDAKGEVEAFIGARIEATGLKSLAEAAPELPLIEHKKVADKP